VHAVVVQADGKIVAAGQHKEVYEDDIGDIALVRYNPDGSLDTTFDGDGIVITSLGPKNDIAQGMVVQSDGRIVVAGSTNRIDRGKLRSDFALVRYNPDGSLDPTFNGDGIVTTPMRPGQADQSMDLILAEDGRLVAAGRSGRDVALARYNPDGSLDPSFGGDGKVVTSLAPADDIAYALARQPDGRLVVAGDAFDVRHGADGDFAIARFEG
jgi:uncharacterized delta-60 repeat protein